MEVIENPHFETPVSADGLYYGEFATSLAEGTISFNGKQNLTKLPSLVFIPGAVVTVTLTMAPGKFWVVVCVPISDDVTMNSKTGDTYQISGRIKSISTVIAA